MTHFDQIRAKRAGVAVAKSRVGKRRSRPKSLYEIESREAERKLAEARKKKKKAAGRDSLRQKPATQYQERSESKISCPCIKYRAMLLHSAKFDVVPMSLWGERFGAFYYFNALLDTPAVSCPTCTSSLIADFPFESTETWPTSQLL